MTTINKNLKAFMRLDKSGKMIPFSLILRKNKPKIGKWAEVDVDKCCSTSTSTTTTSTTQPR